MKVHYELPIHDRILATRRDARHDNKTIEYIDLTAKEWDDLVTYLWSLTIPIPTHCGNLLYTAAFRDDNKGPSHFDNSYRLNFLYSGTHIKYEKANLTPVWADAEIKFKVTAKFGPEYYQSPFRWNWPYDLSK